MRFVRATAAIGLIVGLACSSDSGGGPNTPTPSSVSVNAGNTQVGVAGQTLATPLAVIVRDAASNPVAGVSVTWAAASGGGSVTPTSSTTDASGVASTTRTLGPAAGNHTTTATVSGLAPATFTAVSQIQGAFQMGSRFVTPLVDTVLATTVGQPLVAVVTNHLGVPVPGIIVTWSTTGGQLSQLVDTTDAGGESQVNYTFGATAGAYSAQATVTGLVNSPLSYALTAGAGNPAVLVKTSGDSLTVAASGQAIYTVTTRDAHGNARNGVTIDWAVAGGGGTITPASNITGGSGIASATRTVSANLGDHTATATATGLTGSPATFTTTAAVVVNVVNNNFNPANVTIPVNSSVTWNWVGTTSLHNVTFALVAGAPGNIGNQTSGSGARTFTTAGTFNYECTNHIGMTGSVTVTP